MSWIILTSANGDEKIGVNTDHFRIVQWIAEHGRTDLESTDQHQRYTYEVRETPEQIVALIRGLPCN